MSLDKIKSYADSVLDVYGTEDFSVYLYSLMVLASDKDGLKQVVQATKFSVSHIIENKQRKQNNTACITLSPLDVMPYDKQYITI